MYVNKNIKHVCGDCGYAASYKSCLKKHKEAIHKMGEQQYKCDPCPFESYYSKSLQSHVQNVHLKV